MSIELEKRFIITEADGGFRMVNEEQYKKYAYCEPAKMSDDILDASVQYVKINRELLGAPSD